MTRQAFIDCARACGSDPIAEEQAILSIGREFLPACALVVLDGGDPTEDYWTFLISQTEKAQEEHDREAARVGKLRAYGNAIVTEIAAAFIGAALDAISDQQEGQVT